MKPKHIIGIDPGKKGGYCILDVEGNVDSYGVMPLVGDNIHLGELGDDLGSYDGMLAVIEKVHGMPHYSRKGAFIFGESVGLVKGMCQSMKIPYEAVMPTIWKKKVLQGTKKDKNAAIDFVRRRYPKVDLIIGRSKKPHDGIADAVCIAHWGLLTQI